MDRLPFELISHIFILGCDFAGFDDFIDSRFRSVNPPDALDETENWDLKWDLYRVNITSVSKSWREIAYATSDLWTIISIRYMNLYADTSFNFIEESLEHSKNQPLDIIFCGVSSEARHMSVIWNLVYPILPRCRSLHMIIPSTAFYSLTPLPEDLGLLEEANFISNSGDEISDIRLFPTPSYLPRLRQLRIMNLDGGTIYAAPLEDLHEFIYDYQSGIMTSVLERLRHAHQLVLNCSFYHHDVLPGPVEYPNLQAIEFFDDFIIDFTRAPNLLQLTTDRLGFLEKLKPDTCPNVREINIRYCNVDIWPFNWLWLLPEDVPQHQLMPSVEILRLPPLNEETLRTSLVMLLESNSSYTDRTTPTTPPRRSFPSLRTLFCGTLLPPQSDITFTVLDGNLDDAFIQLLQQRPLLSVIVPDTIMTLDFMDFLAPELRKRILNSDRGPEPPFY